MDCSLPGSSVHGILQARILEWVAISFSRKFKEVFLKFKKKKKDLKSTMYLRKSIDNNQHKVCSYKITGF